MTGDFKTTSKYGDYQLNLDGITFDTDEISAVVFSTKEGHDYGMRHLENGKDTKLHGAPDLLQVYMAARLRLNTMHR